MLKKERSRMKTSVEEIELDRDGTFYFIAGYTSLGFPYGVTWEQAVEDGFLDESERIHWMKMQDEFDDDEIPF